MIKRLKEDTSDNESDSCEKETRLHSTSNSTTTKVTKNGLPLSITPTNFENPIFVDTSESTQELPSVLVQTKNFSGGEGLRFAKLFRKFSGLRNSLMDLGGFKRLMSELGSNADEETMESIFPLADKDKNGHLSLDEFLKIARVAHFHPPLSGLMVFTNKEAVDRFGKQSLLGRAKRASYSVLNTFFSKFK